MQLAGKYGAGVLSVSVIGTAAPDLHKFWQIAEETAAEHGHTVHREDWRMAVAVFLADSRKEGHGPGARRGGTLSARVL